MILLIFFGALALLAGWTTVHDEDLRWIGFWLLIGYALSNFLHANLPVTSMPGPYSVIEVLVLLFASIAWDSHRRCWPLLVLAGVNILSICANIAFASLFPPSHRQIFLFELTTNLCFVAECLLATGVGVYNGLGDGRFAWLSGLRGRVMASYVARTRNGHP